ncbi:MAG: hypothetical protein R3F22_08155 [Lysobacteraceae bacterium]
MRILIAGILGGVAMFVWGAIAHTLLPLGSMGMVTGGPSAATLSALSQDATAGAGIYMLPSPSDATIGDEAAMNAFIEANKDSAYAFVVYQPDGNPGLSAMGPNLLTQFVSDTLAALVLALVLAASAFGMFKRVMIAAGFALFAWLTISVPYWNWYLFPLDFTFGGLVTQVIGWMGAGEAMAWWLGRKERWSRR